MSKLLTMDEAAERLRVSRRTVERYIESGLLKRTKPGGRTLIEERELERFLARGRAS